MKKFAVTMRSIRTKFVILILLSVLTCAIGVSVVSILNINREEEYASTRIINSTCRELSAGLNHKIDTIASSVDSVADIAVDEVPSPEALADDQTRKTFLDIMTIMLRDIAERTEDSVAYYIYICPDLLDEEDSPSGLLLTRPTPNEDFATHELTDISLFEKDDLSHVGWYYQPKDAGEPVWMEPYFNKNLLLHEISYIVPLYRDGIFFGVVGMDIDFDTLTVPVRELSIYDTGYAYLMDDYGKIYSHPFLEEGTVPSETISTLETVIERFGEQDNGDELITYVSFAGSERKSAFTKLHNGMNAVISADSHAIYARRDRLVRITVLITALILLLWVVVTIIITRRVTSPLVQLTKAADQIFQGRLDVDLPEPTNDEVGTLTRSFRVMTQYLKRYISDISSLAYRDPLTDVKNKAAYNEMEKALTDQMREGYRDFAMVVLDANGLKNINDRYGHSRGDLYLQNVSHLICDTFKRSPVYRIGGDEFVVLLEKEDYEARYELMEQLEQEMQKVRNTKDPASRISVAAGVGEASVSDYAVKDVFERADRAMYRKKEEMKHADSRTGR